MASIDRIGDKGSSYGLFVGGLGEPATFDQKVREKVGEVVTRAQLKAAAKQQARKARKKNARREIAILKHDAAQFGASTARRSRRFIHVPEGVQVSSAGRVVKLSERMRDSLTGAKSAAALLGAGKRDRRPFETDYSSMESPAKRGRETAPKERSFSYSGPFRKAVPPEFRYIPLPEVDPDCAADFHRILRRHAAKTERAYAKWTPSIKARFDRFIDRIEREGDGFSTSRFTVRKMGKKGWGTVAKERISPYQPIAIYSGIIAREDSFKPGSAYVFSFAEDWAKEYGVDAYAAGSLARSINHSSSPNATCHEHISGGKIYIVIRAGARGIEPGEEVTIHYGEEYWKNLGIDPEE